MEIKASGRSALMLAAGLFVFFAAPSQAATGADNAAANSKSESAAGAPATLHKNLRYGSRHRKSYAHARSRKVALKAAAARKEATDATVENRKSLSDIPPSVANANAQLWAPGANANPLPAQTNDLPQAASDNPPNRKAGNETLIVAADQLNDVDRALREGNSPAAASAMASANTPPAPVVANNRESSTWDQTSLIGKIFIGFGALLTAASAARMFMA